MKMVKWGNGGEPGKSKTWQRLKDLTAFGWERRQEGEIGNLSAKALSAFVGLEMRKRKRKKVPVITF